MKSALIDYICHAHGGDGVIAGHGSFFRKGRRSPQDVDLIKLHTSKTIGSKQRRLKVCDVEVDLYEVCIYHLDDRFAFEARSGYQYLSRALAGSILIIGDRGVFENVLKKAALALSLDTRIASKGFALDNKQKAVLILRDLKRLDGWQHAATLTSSFDYLIRIAFYIRGEWISPPSCSHYWSEELKAFVDKAAQFLQIALAGDTKLYINMFRSVIEQFEELLLETSV